MIIDSILNRKDDEELIAAGYTEVEYPNGSTRSLKYNAKNFYHEMVTHGGWYGERISKAMDYGTEADIKKILCRYILDNDYNPDICGYIVSRNWLS